MQYLTRIRWISRLLPGTRSAWIYTCISATLLMGPITSNGAMVTYYYTSPTYITVVDTTFIGGTFTTTQRISGSLTFDYPTGAVGPVSIIPIAFTFSNGRHTFSSDDANVNSNFELNFANFPGWLVVGWHIELWVNDFYGGVGFGSLGIQSRLHAVGDAVTGLAETLGSAVGIECASDDCLTTVRLGNPDYAYAIEYYSDEQLRDFWVAAIPEPATLALLGLGVVALAASRRRKN